jgi:beta-mannosidase
MFVQYKIKVTDKIRLGANTLRVVLRSAYKVGTELENKYGKLPVELESHRVYLRKAQYSFGWDWGPAFSTAGLWKDVYLEKTPECCITNVKFFTRKIDNNSAHLEISYDLAGELNDVQNVSLIMGNGSYKYEKNIELFNNTDNKIPFKIENPELWYPVGAGEQKLYYLKLVVKNKSGFVLDEYQKNVGIRTVELRLDEENRSVFRFIINGKPLYAKGVNWIPADSFLPRISENKYEGLLRLARDANVNMVRVWGGGIYESDIFYETCDKMGLLVWQDFMFACASYPEHEKFIDNVKSEVKYQVSRLINHPSLAIWCGNNENEWIWAQKYKPELEEMPGYKIYHELIPDMLKIADPWRPYWPSSPYGFDEDPNSFDSGNTHQWNIWSNWIDYEQVADDKSLFVTEFGFQGPANIDTLNNSIPIDSRHIESNIFRHHNKQVEGPERVNFFLEKHLPVVQEWEDYIYLSQLNQAFALKSCLEHWRTNGITNGAIIWQLNDCWPVTSWSIVDSDSIPKLSYYFVKNIFADCIIYFTREVDEVDIYIQNQHHMPFYGTYEIFVVDAPSGKISDKFSGNIIVEHNSNQVVKSIHISEPEDAGKILVARLYNDKSDVVHTNFYKCNFWKEYKLAVPEICIKMNDNSDNKQICLTSDKPAYFVDLYSEGVEFSNRGFFIMPNEEVMVNVKIRNIKDLKEGDIKIVCLNNFLT